MTLHTACSNLNQSKRSVPFYVTKAALQAQSRHRILHNDESVQDYFETIKGLMITSKLHNHDTDHHT